MSPRATAAWQVARLSEIPRMAGLEGFDAREYMVGMKQRAPHVLERWAAADERFESEHQTFRAVRAFLGVESFGINAVESPEGELLVVPHDELGEGERHEEVYVVLEGRAAFRCDGEAVELERGQLLHALPGVHREAVALETPTVLLIVGGRPGRPYAPPIWASDWQEP